MTVEGGNWGPRRLHFIGIGGCGMSGLAMTVHSLGATVSGSDRADGPFVSRLRERGIEVTIGHADANVHGGAEIVYSSAVPADNPERARGRELGLPEYRRGELLAEVAAGRRCIAVSGTHGKTTTAAMTVHALRGAGRDASFLIGGDILATGTNSHWSDGEWLVIETDESDRSLLALAPEVAIVTNVELEHVRAYRSQIELEQVFAQFLAKSTHAVIWDRPELLKLRAGPVVAFDAPAPILVPGGSRFRWRGFDVTLNIAGEHNARNAAAALEACLLAGAQPDRAVAALSSFTGTRRRLEALGVSPSGARIYDDYAHHPTAVRATLSAARTFDPDRLIAVLQPHSYARTRLMARQFGEALALADLVVVLGVVPGGPTDRPAVSGLRIAQAAAAASPRTVAWLPDFESAERYLASTLRAGDLCVTLGSGNVYELARRLLA
jgi:UDP-N-acetylmuramate--alanine ligase